LRTAKEAADLVGEEVVEIFGKGFAEDVAAQTMSSSA
jgi:hypothetical protein